MAPLLMVHIQDISSVLPMFRLFCFSNIYDILIREILYKYFLLRINYVFGCVVCTTGIVCALIRDESGRKSANNDS